MASTRPLPPGGAGGRRKRPSPPTIDLEATEVEPQAGEPAPPDVMQGDSARPPSAPVPSETAAEAPSTRQESPEPTPSPGAQEKAVPGDASASRPQPEPERVDPSPPDLAQAQSGPSPPAASDDAGDGDPLRPDRSALPPFWGAGAPPYTPPPRDESEPAAARSHPWSWPVIGGAAAVLAIILLGLWLALSPREDAGAPLASRIANLENQVRTLSERPPPVSADPRQVADLAARVAAVEQLSQRLDDLSRRVAAAEQAQRPDTAATTDLTRRLDAVEARIAKLEAAPAPAAAGAADPKLSERIAALEAALKSLSDETSARAKGESALAERVGMAETAVKALAERVGDLGKGVDQAAATAQQADRQAAAATQEAAQTRVGQEAERAMRFAVVTAALRDVVARGAPFAAELAAVKPLVADAGALAPLEPFAATGVPDAAALARELASIMPAVRTRVAPPAPAAGGGFVARLQASAERLVRIRPINAAAGSDPDTVLARLDADIARNDIAGAHADLAKLPPDARVPAEAWSKKAEMREQAVAASERLARDAFAALGQQPK